MKKFALVFAVIFAIGQVALAAPHHRRHRHPPRPYYPPVYPVYPMVTCYAQSYTGAMYWGTSYNVGNAAFLAMNTCVNIWGYCEPRGCN